MRSLKIVWTPFASWCLEEIHLYISRRTFSKRIADKVLNRIILRVEQLKKFPESGQAEPFLTAIGQTSRYLIEGNYKIIYQVDSSQIIVTDIFHVKQSPKKMTKRSKDR